MRGQLALNQVTIGKKQHQLAIAHSVLRLCAHANDRGLEPL